MTQLQLFAVKGFDTMTKGCGESAEDLERDEGRVAAPYDKQHSKITRDRQVVALDTVSTHMLSHSLFA